MKNFRNRKGFSAVEILVFIIIIAIIAAIAVPKLLESKQKADEARLNQARSKADEASAVLTLRAIHRANSTFRLTADGKFGSLDDLSEAKLLDAGFAGEGFNKSGYSFAESITAAGEGFCATAVPVSDSEQRTFAVSESGLIYAGTKAAQNAPFCSNGILSPNSAEPLR